MKNSIYSVHPGVLMTQKWIGELKQKTGAVPRRVARAHQEIRPERRKGTPRVAQGRTRPRHQHRLVARRSAEGKGGESGDPDLYLEQAERDVEKMFSGGKAHLRPLYDKHLKLGLKTGKEAKACPCQTIVPLYRNHVFAQIKPTTQTRIDMGFALGDMKPTGRLIDTGGFAKKDRITHRIPITSMDDIDDEVKHWLKVAYDRDA